MSWIEAFRGGSRPSVKAVMNASSSSAASLFGAVERHGLPGLSGQASAATLDEVEERASAAGGQATAKHFLTTEKSFRGHPKRT